jgi:hypothetical protein
MFKQVTILLSCLALGTCANQQDNFVDIASDYPSNLPATNISVRIAGLSNCSNQGSDELRLNTLEPVTVIVHGCFASAGRFRSLADVYAFHGQQAICFSYDDRERLTHSSTALKTSLAELAGVLDTPRITVIGHSQGGLVARRALIAERTDQIEAGDARIGLVTVSTPFAGIEAAAHCGSTTAAWLSLGLVKLACQIITGQKYQDIPSSSGFIQNPGSLVPSVDRHLRIVTDEINTCRVRGDDGECIEDDFVFSVDEQTQQTVDRQPGLIPITIKAGHVEIVGDNNNAPLKLIGILQRQGFLRETPPEASAALGKMLANLYLEQ